MRVLLRLYPAWWRERYGDEMAALLEDMPPGPFDSLDLALGALDARIHRRGMSRGASEGKESPVSLRIGSGAAVVGGAAWMLTVAVGVATRGGAATFPVLLLATAALLVALAGLSALQYRRFPAAIWTSALLSGGGVLLLFVGVVGQAIVGDEPKMAGLSPWLFTIAGVFTGLVGCFCFGIVTYASRALSRGAAALLSLSAAVEVVGALGVGPLSQGLMLGIGAIGFGVSWILLGLDASRLGSVRLSDQPA